MPRAVRQWDYLVATTHMFISKSFELPDKHGMIATASATAMNNTSNALESAETPLVRRRSNAAQQSSPDRRADAQQVQNGRGSVSGYTSEDGSDANIQTTKSLNDDRGALLAVPEVMHLRHRRATTTDILRADLR